MAQTTNEKAFMNSDTHTELTDSLLHGSITRVILGLICGLVSGVIMLVVSQLFRPEGYGAFWWLQVLGSAFYYGQSTALEVSSQVLMAGGLVHVFFCAFWGLIVGKITSGKSGLGRMLFYGVVLSFLCWLSSNMFAVDIISVQALELAPQWTRVFLFASFAIPLLGLMALIGKKAD